MKKTIRFTLVLLTLLSLPLISKPASGACSASSLSHEACLADELYFPKACQGSTAFTAVQWKTLQGYGIGTHTGAAIPFVGQLVVQKRHCSPRSSGPDCSPWIQDEDLKTAGGKVDSVSASGNLMTLMHSYGSKRSLTAERSKYVGNADGFVLETNDKGRTTHLSILRNPNQSVQLTPQCFRFPYNNQIVNDAFNSSYMEYRSAIVALFSSDVFNDPDTSSLFHSDSCAGPSMTLKDAEARFPIGSGIDLIAIPAEYTAVRKTRTCKLTPENGTECSRWSEAMCDEEWCKTLNARRSVSFFQYTNQDVWILLKNRYSDPGMQVSVATQMASGSLGVGAKLSSALTTLTDRCLRFPVGLTRSGAYLSGWTERRDGVLVKF